MNENEINFELLATELGEIIKWGDYERSVNEINRVASAVFKIECIDFKPENITSVRATLIYNWVISLKRKRFGQPKKAQMLSLFIKQLLPKDCPERDKLLAMLGEVGIIPDAPPDFEAKMADVKLAKILAGRWTEAQKCLDREAYLAAMIMMGSLLEGLLSAVISANPAVANRAKQAPIDTATQKPKKFSEWTFSDMINVAHECGWLKKDIRSFSHELRDYRNMVHPVHHKNAGFDPSIGTCRICWEVVRAGIADLMGHLK